MDAVGKFLKAAFVGGLILVLTSVLVTPAEAAIMTGTYTGTGVFPLRITTGLARLKALTIVELAEHGQGAVAYTTEAIQSTGSGFFLNGNKKERGIAFDVADFIVSHPDFNQPGVVYAWEARGD